MYDCIAMARMPDLEKFGAKHGIRIVTVEDLIRYRMRNEVLVERVVDTSLQMEGLGEFRLCMYKARARYRLHPSICFRSLSTRSESFVHVDSFGGYSAASRSFAWRWLATTLRIAPLPNHSECAKREGEIVNQILVS